MSCRGGRKRIPGLVYSAKKPIIAQRLAWRAAVQASLTCPELALQMRELDTTILWDALKRPAEDGKWSGAEIIARRPCPCSGWQYLLRGGPKDLPEVWSPLAEEPIYGKEVVQEHFMIYEIRYCYRWSRDCCFKVLHKYLSS